MALEVCAKSGRAWSGGTGSRQGRLAVGWGTGCIQGRLAVRLSCIQGRLVVRNSKSGLGMKLQAQRWLGMKLQAQRWLDARVLALESDTRDIVAVAM